MSDEDLKSLLFNDVPFRTLLKLEKTGEVYASEISTDLDITYSHVVKVLNRFEKHGLTETYTVGRKKIHEITDDGLELAEAVRSVDEVIGGEDERRGRSLQDLDLSA